MGLDFYWCDPPVYHRLAISRELAEKLIEVGTDNNHLFIAREDVEELLRDPDLSEEDRGELKRWLAASPDEGWDELYFSYWC